MFRKVLLRKIKGSSEGGFPDGTERVGWEKEPPRVGARYTVYEDNGKVYRTSLIRKVSGDGFVTTHSTYVLKVLEDSQGNSESGGKPDRFSTGGGA